MPHHGDVERHLAEFPARVRVGQEQHVDVRLQENTDRQLPRPQEDLGRRLVLAVEDLRGAGAVSLGRPPREPDVELGTLVKKLLDQPPDVRADAAGIDPVVVVQIFERQGREERIHPAELVVIDRHAPDAVVANVRQAELNVGIFTPDAQQRLATTVSREHIAEVSAPLPGLLRLLLKPLELGESACDFEIRCPLATIARGVRQGEVILGVQPVLD